MNVAIRVDASRESGTGHFFRCLTLADALKFHDVEPRFVSRHLPAHLQEILRSRSLSLTMLPASKQPSRPDELDHSGWLGVAQGEDALATATALEGRTWDWLVADHYALDSRWETALRGSAARVMAIDDLADRVHDCDLLLDQNFYADMNTRYEGKLPAQCRTLFGPQFSLLRDEFRAARSHARPRAGAVRRVLVFFGGVDAANFTGRVVDVLAAMDLPEVAVDVVVGLDHPRRADIVAKCAANNFDCHVQTTRMAELMAAADLSIGAGGSAVWERCCLGLPTLTFSTAANQDRQAADAAAHGLLCAPGIEGDWATGLQRHIVALCENENLRRMFSLNGMRAVDGQGVARVVAAMGYGGIELREATAEDSRRIFEWRNHASVREQSRSSQPLAWEDHDPWFRATLASDKRVLLVGSAAGQPVGVIRFDLEEGVAEVSIYLVPGAPRARGQGRALLGASERWLVSNRPQVSSIRAFVLGNNEVSRRLFEGSGYRTESFSFVKRLQPA